MQKGEGWRKNEPDDEALDLSDRLRGAAKRSNNMILIKAIRDRMVYNDWGLYGFVQMLEYNRLRFGKELFIIDERDTTKRCAVGRWNAVETMRAQCFISLQ